MNTQQDILQGLMNDLGLAGLPQDKQEEIAIKMTEVILKRMFIETMDRLKPRDQETYEELLDKGSSPEEIENFLQSKIENYENILLEVAQKFKKEMLENKEEI